VPANLACGRPADGQVPVLATWGPVRQTYAGLLEIEPDWVAQHLAGIFVLDVREREELQSPLGAIPGARHVPLDELRGRVEEIPRDKPVIAVCHAGMRSGQATVILRAAGFSEVANLRGGMLLWSALGLPVERA
jgi:rhodanese-related sulfurtransferase